MNQMPLISVIIPVYNAEKFIDRAVQSVLCQMDGKIELILVDDGSTDGGGSLCDIYAQDNENVYVVHKKNGGISTARNAGITAASGEYVMFLDADDYLEPEACGEVAKVILAHHPDMIDFGWRYVSNGSAMAPVFHKLPKNRLLGEKELKETILPPLLNLRNDPDNFIFDFSCTKVFRSDIINNHEIHFDESRRIWEDRPFVVNYLRYCHNFYALDRCLYNYVDMPGSLSRRYSLDFFRIIIENYQMYRRLFGQDYDFDTEYSNNYWCHAIENMIFHSLEQTENQEQIREKILETLADSWAVYWYAKRNPENTLERKVSEMVISGKTENALIEYEREWKKMQKHQALNHVAGRVKHTVKRILGR